MILYDSTTCIFFALLLIVSPRYRCRSLKFWISPCRPVNFLWAFIYRHQQYNWQVLNSLDSNLFFSIFCPSCRKTFDMNWRLAMPGHVENSKLFTQTVIFFKVRWRNMEFLCSRKDWREPIHMIYFPWCTSLCNSERAFMHRFMHECMNLWMNAFMDSMRVSLH